MGWPRSFVGACALVIVAQGAMAAAKQRRQWVDPPVDPPAASTPHFVAPQPIDASDAQTTESIEVWPTPMVAPAAQPRVIDVSPSGFSTCATRVYTVLSGATIRVHAC